MKQMIVRCIEMVEQHQQRKKVRTNITQGVEQEKVMTVATAITRRPGIGIVVGHRLCQGHIAGGTISMMVVRDEDGEQHQEARHQKHITNDPISCFPTHDANVRKKHHFIFRKGQKERYFSLAPFWQAECPDELDGTPLREKAIGARASFLFGK